MSGNYFIKREYLFWLGLVALAVADVFVVKATWSLVATRFGISQNHRPAVQTAYVGVFVSSAPSDPASLAELDSVAAMGCNIVYNYSAIEGNSQQILAYLNHASGLGLKVIVGLDSLYQPGDEATALQTVGNIQSHPAVWGFGIADEKPEAPADSAAWLPVITQRYQKVKALTPKPVMAIAVGISDSSHIERQAFLRSFAPAVDTLAIDTYPVPYAPITGIAGLVADGPADRDKWFIAQAFSWASYPDTAKSLGYDLGKARAPTAAEMQSMARQAIAGGATSILFYSYFDIKSQPAQVLNLTGVVRALRSN